MGQLVEEFVKTDFYPLLDIRGPSFARMIEHIEASHSLPLVIETGTARIQGNWGGDGQSTLIWDWAAERLPISVLSIDIDSSFVDIARNQVKNVHFAVGDSVATLSAIPEDALKRVGLIYLDSYDWTPETQFDSAFHHMAELASIWAHLPSGCMVAVDDCHSQFVGKHVFVYNFMNKLGIQPTFTGYQAGWIKP